MEEKFGSEYAFSLNDKKKEKDKKEYYKPWWWPFKAFGDD